mgnify:FL=1
MKLLTEPEVAEILRCSRSKIKRLRLSGALAYIPGRPVLVAETDLAEYLDRLKQNAKPASPAPPATPEEEYAAMVRNAREWAIRKKHKPRRAPRMSKPTK